MKHVFILFAFLLGACAHQNPPPAPGTSSPSRDVAQTHSSCMQSCVKVQKKDPQLCESKCQPYAGRELPVQRNCWNDRIGEKKDSTAVIAKACGIHSRIEEIMCRDYCMNARKGSEASCGPLCEYKDAGGGSGWGDEPDRGSTGPKQPDRDFCKKHPKDSRCGNFEPYCERDPEASSCVGSEAYCRKHPNASVCENSKTYCELHPRDSKCVGSEAYCELDPQDSRCGTSEAYCRRNPEASACADSQAYCDAHPQDSSCTTSEAYCRLNPQASACSHSEAYCRLNPTSSNCTPPR